MGLKKGHRRWTLSPTLFQIPARSFSIIFTLLLFSTSFLIGCGDDDLQGAGESISVPNMPTGPDTVTWYEEANYSAGGAVSSMGHRLEYRFDLDAEENHNYSNWSLLPALRTFLLI
ncbi:MAG: hypothetical protein GTO42_08855 [Candidatus Latescibacteria bacterium]|nr:hypothetical protein [Candidatus Latescibacterota bacterium]NIO29070.1 hypothetical protein [Candidatus Latescibacterota bacterium]NIO56695.1 hypothetical protein [Candidatus Latescibacterota bacterium]NIT02278.1 hypothetical protein [Candidatus Latescibacterota bacterium]NIT39163.1 hypothetical protein [Candidatus Latescibacterota bacterium]